MESTPRSSRRRCTRRSSREDVVIGSPYLTSRSLGDEVSGTGSPATTLQVGVDPAGVNGLVAPQEGFHQPNFHVDNLESYRMDDRFVAERDAWCFAFIGKWFRFKDMELEDDLDFKDMLSATQDTTGASINVFDKVKLPRRYPARVTCTSWCFCTQLLTLTN